MFGLHRRLEVLIFSFVIPIFPPKRPRCQMPRLRGLVNKGVVSEDAVKKLGSMNIHSAEDLLVFTSFSFTE